MPDRIHHAVPLTADEAIYVAREAGNDFTKCCGHLDIFHARGTTTWGGEWRNCQVDRCGCTEFPPDAEYVAFRERQDREERKAFWRAFELGVAAVLVLGTMTAVIVVLVA